MLIGFDRGVDTAADPAHHVVGDVLGLDVSLRETEREGGGDFVDAILPDPGMLAKERLEAFSLSLAEAEGGAIRKEVEELFGRKLDVVRGAILYTHVGSMYSALDVLVGCDDALLRKQVCFLRAMAEPGAGVLLGVLRTRMIYSLHSNVEVTVIIVCLL